MTQDTAPSRSIDDRVGVLLDTLERLGIREDTIMVFCSDHGDFMGEHHALIKCNAFYDCLTRVPLLLSDPRVLPRGEVRTELVSTIDLMPTLLRLIGLSIPNGMQGQSLPGTPDAPDARCRTERWRQPDIWDRWRQSSDRQCGLPLAGDRYQWSV